MRKLSANYQATDNLEKIYPVVFGNPRSEELVIEYLGCINNFTIIRYVVSIWMTQSDGDKTMKGDS